MKMRAEVISSHLYIGQLCAQLQGSVSFKRINDGSVENLWSFTGLLCGKQCWSRLSKDQRADIKLIYCTEILIQTNKKKIAGMRTQKVKN